MESSISCSLEDKYEYKAHYWKNASRAHLTCLREQIVESAQSLVPSTCFPLDKREQFTRRRGERWKDCESSIWQPNCVTIPCLQGIPTCILSKAVFLSSSAKCILSINYAIIRIRCDMNYCLPFTNLARKLAWNSENEHGIDKKRMDMM